jgi:hypothetical protein
MKISLGFKHLHMFALICGSVVIGCGGSSGPKLADPVKVKGIVALDSQPLSNAMVYFVPLGGTEMGNGATGVTDATGTFELVTVRGRAKQAGAIPGEYRVSISRLVGPDGNSVSPNADVPPADLGAVESLPARYSDVMMTELKANVTPQGGTFDFSITSQ